MTGNEIWRRRRGGWLARWLPDEIYSWRDRLIGNPKFQRWAARFPLTRPIANRRAAAAFDLCAGFVYSQVLFACVDLKLLEMLGERPLDVNEISARTMLQPEAAMRLLNAACALGLVSRRRLERFGLGMEGAAIVANPSIALMVQHHAMLYRDLNDPVALLRGAPTSRALANYWPYATAERPSSLAAHEVEGYSRLMSASQEFIAGDIIGSYRFEQHRMLMDVGGGEGTFLCAVASAAPSLKLKLFDLPAVADRARQRLDTAGLSGRSEVIGGSFRSDPLPAGADAISLVRILHDHDDAIVMDLLRAARGSLPANGVLLIAEPFAGVAGAERIGDAYFGFYLLAMGSGRARTATELGEMLRTAGFARVAEHRTPRPLLTGFITAHVT